VGQFPSYGFLLVAIFLTGSLLLKRALLNFEFSSLIQQQANYFSQQHSLIDGDYISLQFRRGGFKKHCRTLFSYGMTNWAFDMLSEDKFHFDKSS
jgi:hypothetical protein